MNVMNLSCLTVDVIFTDAYDDMTRSKMRSIGGGCSVYSEAREPTLERYELGPGLVCWIIPRNPPLINHRKIDLHDILTKLGFEYPDNADRFLIGQHTGAWTMHRGEETESIRVITREKDEPTYRTNIYFFGANKERDVHEVCTSLLSAGYKVYVRSPELEEVIMEKDK